MYRPRLSKGSCSIARCCVAHAKKRGLHNDTGRAPVSPAPSLIVVQVRQLLAVDGASASVANILHRLDGILIKRERSLENRVSKHGSFLTSSRGSMWNTIYNHTPRSNKLSRSTTRSCQTRETKDIPDIFSLALQLGPFNAAHLSILDESDGD